MDRFEWATQSLLPNEQYITEQTSVRLYDGENKTNFDHGHLILTTHRIIWTDMHNKQYCIALNLSLIVFIESVPGTFSKSPKIIVHLNPVPAARKPGPEDHSSFCHIKLSFKKGGNDEFQQHLETAIRKADWKSTNSGSSISNKKVKAGIAGIERQIQSKNMQTDKSISKAFEDLRNLMDTAKDMVTLSKSISTKIKEKQGDITENETIRFKSYLLSLGIDDPVTKNSYNSGDVFHRELAKQIADCMYKQIQESGGIMTLSDVYCRLNRARGLELLSPEDLVNACEMLQVLKLPIKFKTFDSGVKVLQIESHDEKAVIAETVKLIEENNSLTPGDLSIIIDISVILAKERLLAAEKMALACRDDSIEGLRFYPNLFSTKQS